MNPTASRFATLMGTASLVTLSSALAAQGQQVAQTQTAQAAEEVPEQVLITGSLIHGTAAVGVPVTNLSPQDFSQTGALTTSDLFRSIPSANVSPGPVATNSGANVDRGTRVNIRGLDGNTGVRTLLMVDGMRFPPQAFGGCTVDPSIIPALSQDRIDVLVDGASATYGSDAVAGVINIILKRGFDGAITQLRYGHAKGKEMYLASQLWGRTWDGGDITLSYEWLDDSPIQGKAHSNFSVDYSPWGLENRTPLASSIPGTISTGAPATTYPGGVAANLGSMCTNCFAIPRNTGGAFNPINGGPTAPFSASTLNWANFNVAANTGTNGTRNEFNPYSIAWYDASQQRNGGAITLDQRLTKTITFTGEGFYSNRRSGYLNPSNLSPSSTDLLVVGVPTFNPYYPTGGAPTNLRVNYNMGLENPSFTASYELAARYMGGLNIDLPGSWSARIYYGETYDQNYDHVTGAVNRNAVSAALGWTIAATAAVGTTPGIATWTRPGTVPYLNLFCDAQKFNCNSQNTLNYISAVRSFDEKYWINEKGVTFDGPLFGLPAGQVKAAVGANYTAYHFAFRTNDTTGSPSLIVPLLTEAQSKQVWAAFTQINIPVFGDTNAIPGFKKLELEGSWRHDQYSDVGGTSNPKVAFNWLPIDDLTIRGSWGTSFRAPSFAEQSNLVKTVIAAQNSPLFPQPQTLTVTCGADPHSASGKLINPGPGLIGWNGVGSNNGTPGVNCGPGAQPVGLTLLGSAGSANAAGFRQYINTSGQALHPEQATNWGIGADYSPTNFLKGLDIQATWYSVKINGNLQGFANPNSNSFSQAGLGFAHIVPTDLALAGVDVAGCSNNNTPTTCPEFEAMVTKLLADPRNPVPPQIATQVLWINDGSIFNAGYTKLQGLDWNISYDWDMGNAGAFNVGMVGTYYLHRYEVNFIGNKFDPEAAAVLDQFHTTLGSVGNIAQTGVESLPRMRYRARLGWSNGPWSLTGFMDYQSHFFHTQNAPPNVNGQCSVAGGTVGGGTFPCLINNYTNVEPPFYTFDLSAGYDTGDDPANTYLKHIGIQLVIQNIMDKHPPFEYRIGTGGGNPVPFDILKSDQGRTVTLILTKTW